MASLDRLEQSLKGLLSEDKLYKLRDGAKKRAVEQRVPTYDQFEDIVKASHLQPLSNKESLTAMSYNRWNPETERSDFYTPKNAPETAKLSSGAKPQTTQNHQKTLKTKLSSSDQILARWQKADPSERRSMVLSDPDLSVENSGFYSTVLDKDGEFLEQLLECYTCNEDTENFEQFRKVVLQISKTPGFSLAVDFLEDDGQEAALEKLLT